MDIPSYAYLPIKELTGKEIVQRMEWWTAATTYQMLEAWRLEALNFQG